MSSGSTPERSMIKALLLFVGTGVLALFMGLAMNATPVHAASRNVLTPATRLLRRRFDAVRLWKPLYRYQHLRGQPDD